jgi:hypothetical protein
MNKSERKAYNRAYRKTHQSEQRVQRKRWLKNHPEYVMWYEAKRRAKRNGISFTIGYKDVVIPEYCPYLGIKLQHAIGRMKSNSPSLDRIINHLGYVQGNIEVISWKANKLKSNSIPVEMMERAQEMLRIAHRLISLDTKFKSEV